MLFSKNDIFRKDWLDVVFAGRNKEYGAYQLRLISNRATNWSLLIMLVAVVGLCSLSFIPKVKNNAKDSSIVPDLEVYATIDIDEPIFEIPKPEEKSAMEQQVAQDVPAQDLIRFTEINPTDHTVADEHVATVDELKDRKKMLAAINMKGVKGGELIARGKFGRETRDGGATGRSEGDPTGAGMGIDDVFSRVEIMPEPPGGMSAFVKWVGSNYNFSQAAQDSQVSGLIRVSFVVEKDGSLTDFKVLDDMGFGTGAAAIALLKKAKKWKPGIQNGIPVRVSYALPIRLSTVQ